MSGVPGPNHTAAVPETGAAGDAARPGTARLRRKARLIVHTGDGKGKSTAAFGMGLRSWAHGWSVGVFQFIKSGKWPTGERLVYERLGAIHDSEGIGGPVEWQCLGRGWSWLRGTDPADHEAMARAGWEHVRDRIAAQAHDIYILDEFAHVLNRGWVDPDRVARFLAGRPGVQHVVITGRRCPRQIIDVADLVTSMDKVKHPFDEGERGQAGIEW
ncbi:cob(I)yrinic acid a,c-diamide adenosyltransferase [uncultured Propionibacterium sp.]|uniref:cob(I)yrinic acid a,c-diamide adenosyltransferase n=1 Tax=uncultured Propionibacterium sp. TaxID=218066 RepID=UPI0029315086|nr:cob(I)yrinic acid a,c-diamide adenosyltransferase [uncultured Propionibacterium sp.]